MTDFLLASPLAHAVSLALVSFVWQGTLLALLTMVALAMARRAGAGARYSIACLSLVATAVTPLVTTVRALSVTPLSFTSVLNGSGLHFSITSSGQAGSSLDTWLPSILLAWILGVLVLTVRLVRGWLQVERIRRHAQRLTSGPLEEATMRIAANLGIARVVRVAQSAVVDVPTVIGWIRPTVLLPLSALSGLSLSQLEAILMHELAHIRRHDYAVNMLQNVVETLLFYHPAVWWISRQVRVEREHCADDLAATLCGDRVAYAGALASLEESRQAALAFGVAANGTALLPRIRRVLGRPPAVRRPQVSTVVVMVSALAVTVSGYAAGARRENVVARDVRIDVPAPVELPIPDVHPARVDVTLPAQEPTPPVEAPVVEGESVQPGQVVTVGNEIRPPTKIYHVSPIYPEIAKAAGLSGVVFVEVTIDVDGNVTDLRVTRSAGVLDQAAIDAISQWKYTPTLLNGVPVSVKMTVTVNFTLDNSAPAQAARRVAPAAPGALGSISTVRVGGDVRVPAKIHDARPAYPEIAKAARMSGIVFLEAIVAKDGSVRDVRVTRSAGVLDQAAIDAVRQWRYVPTAVNGEPVEVVLNVTINFTLPPAAEIGSN